MANPVLLSIDASAAESSEAEGRERMKKIHDAALGFQMGFRYSLAYLIVCILMWSLLTLNPKLADPQLEQYIVFNEGMYASMPFVFLPLYIAAGKPLGLLCSRGPRMEQVIRKARWRFRIGLAVVLFGCGDVLVVQHLVVTKDVFLVQIMGCVSVLALSGFKLVCSRGDFLFVPYLVIVQKILQSCALILYCLFKQRCPSDPFLLCLEAAFSVIPVGYALYAKSNPMEKLYTIKHHVSSLVYN